MEKNQKTEKRRDQNDPTAGTTPDGNHEEDGLDSSNLRVAIGAATSEKQEGVEQRIVMRIGFRSM